MQLPLDNLGGYSQNYLQKSVDKKPKLAIQLKKLYSELV